MELAEPTVSTTARKTGRSRLTNNLFYFPGHHGKSATGRRFRDICQAALEEMGLDQTDLSPGVTSRGYFGGDAQNQPTRYVAFADSSSVSRDSFVVAIAHKEGEIASNLPDDFGKNGDA